MTDNDRDIDNIIPTDDGVKGVNINQDTDNADTENGKHGKHTGTRNLIPLNRQTKDKQKEICSKGGIVSGQKRREKKHMREIAQTLLAKDMDKEQIEEILGTAQTLLDGDMTVAAVLTARIMQEAAQGNTKAYEVLRDTAGYKPTEQVEIGTIDPGTEALLDKIALRTGISGGNR